MSDSKPIIIFIMLSVVFTHWYKFIAKITSSSSASIGDYDNDTVKHRKHVF